MTDDDHMNSVMDELYQLGGEEVTMASKLVEKAKRYSDKKSWALTYVYNNEAYELLQPKLTAATAALRALVVCRLALLQPLYFSVSILAEYHRQRALYKVIPTKWHVDVEQNLLEHAEKCIKEGKNLGEAVRFCTAAYQLNIEDPAPLLLRAGAFIRMGCPQLAYVDINEARELAWVGDSPHLLGRMEAARNKLHTSFKPAKNIYGGFTSAQLITAMREHTALHLIVLKSMMCK